MRLLPCCAVLFALVLSGCRSGGTRSVPAAAPASTADPTVFVIDRTEELELDAFRDSVDALLMNRAYDMLDSTAADLAENDRRFSNDVEKLPAFYRYGLGEPPREGSEGLWVRQIARLREWHATRPNSVAAQVGLAFALCGYGWHARGTGVASSVTPEGWRLLDERVAEAWRVLQAVRARRNECPQWYIAAHVVALAQNWEPEECEQLWREAVAAMPASPALFVARAHQLLPRWGGEPGAWERFADYETHTLPRNEGDIVYAHVIVSQMKLYADLLHESDADWPRARSGLMLMIERHPASVGLKSRLCLLAMQAGDIALGRRLFQELGDRVAINVWQSGARYLHYRAIATNGTGLAAASVGPNR